MSSGTRTWLTGWCVFVALFGLALAGAGTAATDGPARWLFRVIGGRELGALDERLRFSTALMGCVTLGWALTLLATLQAAWRLGDAAAPVWRTLMASVLVWYGLDSTLSVATGFPLNAVSNTVIAGGLLVPVLRSGVLSRRAPGGVVPAV